MDIPMVRLNDGNSMPQLGLGVWKMRDGEEVRHAVDTALQNGYRLIDTAAVYGNEGGVGEGVRRSGITRDEIFVTTKLWNGDQGYDSALRAFDTSLSRLGMDYVDLYLIHWPVPAMDKYVDSWKALLEVKESGRARSVGVCNFGTTELERLMNETGIAPAVNQIELHPHLQQAELRAYCNEKGIQIESWSPIGGSGGDLLNDPKLILISEKYDKSPAQVVIRWHLQLGLVVIPKSSHDDRIKENIDVFDFELDEEDMKTIASMDMGTRRGPDPATFGVHTRTNVMGLAHKLRLI